MDLLYQDDIDVRVPQRGNYLPVITQSRNSFYLYGNYMSVKDRLIEFIGYLELKPKSFEQKHGFANGFVRNIGFSISKNSITKLNEAFPNLNTNWLLTGEGKMLKGDNDKIESNSVLIGEMPAPGEENPTIDFGNGRFIMVVPLVPLKSYAGYIDNYNNQEFFEGLGVHTITVTNQYRGRYMAFVVKGESMSNGTDESINEGDIVTGREIQRHHWRNKLHLHRFEDYVIVHKDGIVTKRIIGHDTERGIITCNSLNPDKARFPDFDILLDECLQILNIVAVTKSK